MPQIPASEREKRQKAQAQSQSAGAQWRAAAKAKGKGKGKKEKADAGWVPGGTPGGAGNAPAAPAAPVIPAAPSIPFPGGAPGLPGGGLPSPFPDWQLDAGYLDTTSRASADLEGARARTLEGQRALLLGLGDSNLATQLLGADDPTVAAVGANPFSQMAQLKRAYAERQQGTTENLNKQGLLYSGARAKALTDLTTAEQGDVYSAQASAMDQLTRLRDGLTGAETGYRDTLAAAASAAKERAQAEAIAYGYGFQDPTASGPVGAGEPTAPPPPATALPVAAAPAPVARRQERAKRQKANAQATSASTYWRNAAAAQGRR